MRLCLYPMVYHRTAHAATWWLRLCGTDGATAVLEVVDRKPFAEYSCKMARRWDHHSHPVPTPMPINKLCVTAKARTNLVNIQKQHATRAMGNRLLRHALGTIRLDGNPDRQNQVIQETARQFDSCRRYWPVNLVPLSLVAWLWLKR